MFAKINPCNTVAFLMIEMRILIGIWKYSNMDEVDASVFCDKLYLKYLLCYFYFFRS